MGALLTLFIDDDKKFGDISNIILRPLHAINNI
jgi:hypothetical protein